MSCSEAASEAGAAAAPPPASHVQVLLSSSPLLLEECVAFVSLPEAGAVVSFLGLTRTPGKGGQPVQHLLFEAYEGMARTGLAAIAQEAAQRFQLSRVCIAHRLGVVPLGQASLCVCASSPHRAPALEALGWIVDSVKARATIFKKEVYLDGSGQWMQNCCAGAGGGGH